jgi:hypothetical protein
MKPSSFDRAPRLRFRAISCAALVLTILVTIARSEDPAWPPALPGAVHGTVTLTTDAFLTVPPSVMSQRTEGTIAPFEVAKTAPTVELALHDRLGPDAAKRRLWSSWGDICLASDGRVYCAIGDHGDDKGGDARCFLYRWDPATKRLEQIVDMNRVVPPQAGQPAWSKVHAKIDEGLDGKIYFSCTLNGGQRASQPEYGFNERLPGGQVYRYHPDTGQTEVFANLLPRRCTATSILDRERNIWWCNLEAGNGDALWGLNLLTKEPVYRGEDGSVGFNRAFALLRNGDIVFNGPSSLRRLDTNAKTIVELKSTLPDSPGMRSATRETKDGFIFGVTQQTSQLFRYAPAKDELTMLGANWLKGEYTTVCELSPDERFIYFLPGSHGKAWTYGTPVVQYEIATGKRKVLAFLAPAIDERFAYVPAGTYGMKLSADGSTIYVNFNGHPADRIRPEKMKPIGFGLTGFAAIHIPASER